MTRVRCEIPSLPLPSGRFYVWVGIYRNWTNGEELFAWQPLKPFEVYGPSSTRRRGRSSGCPRCTSSPSGTSLRPDAS